MAMDLSKEQMTDLELAISIDGVRECLKLPCDPRREPTGVETHSNSRAIMAIIQLLNDKDLLSISDLDGLRERVEKEGIGVIEGVSPPT